MHVFDHGQVHHTSQGPLRDTMTASSPYTTPGPVKPPVPPVPHPKPKPSPNTARDDVELEGRLALPRSETLTHLLSPRNSLAGGHEPPPVPTTPPPESPKNRCVDLGPASESAEHGVDSVQDDVYVDLAGKHEPPPVPTTPPPPPPQGRSTHSTVYSTDHPALGPDVDVAGVDSTGKHEPPPVPHTPPPPSPKGRNTHGAARSITRCALSYGNSVDYVNLAGKHEPPPQPITPPPSPPKGKSMHHALLGEAQSAAVFDIGVFAQFMLAILPEVAFVFEVVMGSRHGALSVVDTVLPTVPCVSVAA
ncbi:hypothetical protein FRC08_011619 [Ceratobasidium sp. 394]|nr:hypothetical protein FRC08_011619 [Ceratobasidium sp. 394]